MTKFHFKIPRSLKTGNKISLNELYKSHEYNSNETKR